MKKSDALWLSGTLLLLSLTGSVDAQPLHFQIKAGSSAVAIQFDVMTDTSSAVLNPVFEGVSPHTVESHSSLPGKTRHVVYTSTGLPITTNGIVGVTFTADEPISNGQIQITGIVASNASGGLIPSATVNALPLIIGPTQAHRSAEVGSSIRLEANLVDPDGTVVIADHRMNGVSLGNPSYSAPFAISWALATAGTFAHSVRATDDSGGVADLPIGSIRAYGIADLTDFAAFGQIHFGTGAPPAWYSFDGDPLSVGIDNGIAHLLGINPHSPDRSRLPKATVEIIEGERHLVMRFTRRTAAPDAGWSVWESGTLATGTWSEVGTQTISESDLGNGLTQVTIRRPLGATPPGKLFLQLEATP